MFLQGILSKITQRNMDTIIQSEPYSGTAAFAERIVPYNPERGTSKKGKSVEYALLFGIKYWFPICDTHHRVPKIYDKIVSLCSDGLEPYFGNPSSHRIHQRRFQQSHTIHSWTNLWTQDFCFCAPRLTTSALSCNTTRCFSA